MSDEATEPKKKRGCGWWLAVGAAVMVGLLVLSVVFGPSEEEMAEIRAEREAEEAAEAQAEAAERAEAAVSEQESAYRTTAAELFQLYARNEVAAQAEIGDRPVLITGTIESVELDMFDEPKVRLQTGEMFQSVSLDFDAGDVEMAGALSPGQEFTALCREITESLGTPLLDDCAPVGN